MKITKDTGISIGALVVLFGIFSWVTDKIDTKTDKTETKKIELKTEKNEEEIDKEENINIKQTTLLEQLCISVERLNEKIDNE